MTMFEDRDFNEDIKRELFEINSDVLDKFTVNFNKEIEEFVKEADKAFKEWERLDSEINDDEQKAYIAAFIFNAINSVIVSEKLLIHGYMTPSGNLVRTAMESLAMAILCSNKKLPFFERIKNDKFLASKAVATIESNAKEFGINEKSFKGFKDFWKFYHKYSHATFLSIASQISFSEGSKLYFGSVFDKDKIPNYKKELDLRIHIIKNFENIIKGIEDNIN